MFGKSLGTANPYIFNLKHITMHRISLDEFNRLLQEKYEYLQSNMYCPPEIDGGDFSKFCYSVALEQINNCYILDVDDIPQFQI